MLRARLVYQQPSAARAISFEYLNRQLVWSELRWGDWVGGCWLLHMLAGRWWASWLLLPRGSSGPLAWRPSLALLLPACPCSELLLFLLPLVNVKAIKHALRSYLPRLPMLAGAGGALALAPGGQQDQGSGQQQQCGICSTVDILAPYAAVPCGHRFCYYCLRSHCLADAQYSCPLCLRRVDAMRQLGPPRAAGSGGSGSATGGGGDAGGGGPGGDSEAKVLARNELSLAGWLAERHPSSLP